MQLGFIGLGHLGSAIAGRLVSCGHTLTTWNRSDGKGESLQHTAVPFPKAVAEAADVIFLCLFDSKAVDDVLNGENGLLRGDLNGKTIIDLTTNHYRSTVSMHSVKKRGLSTSSPRCSAASSRP